MPFESPPPSSSDDDDDPLAPLRRPPRPASGWLDRAGLDRLQAWLPRRGAVAGGRNLTGVSVPAGLALAAAVVVALVVVVVLVVVRNGPGGGGSSPSVSLPMAHGPATSGSVAPGAPGDAANPTSAVLVLQAAGAVARPGVYRLPAGSRVGDLVEAAGGFAPDADGDVVNLAAPLADGARVYVPRRGELQPPGPIVDGGGSPGGGAGGAAGPGASAPIDLNSATVEQLDTLPGVGPSTAAAIVDDRRQHGPFKSVDDLGRVRGIGPAKLAALRARVRV